MTELPRIPVVYTAGKVGSTTISSAVVAAGSPCLDIHYLNKDRLMQLGSKRLLSSVHQYRHVVEALGWRELIMQHRARFNFVTAVRDPIEQAISSAFQNLDRFDPNGIGYKAEAAEMMVSDFIRTWPMLQIHTWFEEELQHHLELDVLGQPFAPSRYWVAETPTSRLIILRTDASDKQKEEVLSKFLWLDIKLRRENEASAKSYRDLYAAFLKFARFPTELLERVYETPFCRRFWSDEERRAMIKKWQ